MTVIFPDIRNYDSGDGKCCAKDKCLTPPATGKTSFTGIKTVSMTIIEL
jgi:hypothetical protein